jgi:hypothetical protein
MTRREDWPAVLAAEIDRARLLTFQWGQHDCATWAFDVRRAMTGIDAAAAWRGRYSTASGSVRVMRRLGWPDLPAMGCALLGEPILPLLAQRGDVAMCGGAFGVVTGSHGFFLAESGLTERPMMDATMAWRV